MRDVKAIITTGWANRVELFLARAVQHYDIRDLTVIPRMRGYSFTPYEQLIIRGNETLITGNGLVDRAMDS